jgi:hypothetical protein
MAQDCGPSRAETRVMLTCQRFAFPIAAVETTITARPRTDLYVRVYAHGSAPPRDVAKKTRSQNGFAVLLCCTAISYKMPI